MKLIQTIVLLLLISGLAQAQMSEPTRTEPRLFKINLLAPGFEYEIALGSSTTLNINPYLTGGYASSEGLLVFPAIQGQFRKYYNLIRRQAKGKRTTGNSGNFIGLAGFGVGRSITSTEGNPVFQNYYGAGPVWGLQRTYQSKLNIGLSGGVGYAFSPYSNNQRLALLLNFRLGWVLSKKSFH